MILVVSVWRAPLPPGNIQEYDFNQNLKQVGILWQGFSPAAMIKDFDINSSLS